MTISSLSKVVAPGLRIGWLRAPEAILRPRAIAKQAADLDTFAFVPGFPFFALEPDHRTLRLSFTTHVAAEIAEGLARLGRASRA